MIILPVQDRQKVRTINEMWSVYKEEHIDHASSSPGRASSAWASVAQFFGNMTPPEITKGTVAKYVRGRLSGEIKAGCKDEWKTRGAVGNGTIINELIYLRAAVNYCLGENIVLPEAIPVGGRFRVPMPPKPQPRHRWLSLEERAILVDAAAARRRGDQSRLSRLERFIALGLYTGSRKTAMEQLPWPLVDFKAGVIRYDELWADDPKRRNGATKKRRACCPMHPKLRAILERAWDERLNDEWVLDEPATIDKAFAAVALDCKWDDVTPHTMRHTFISQALVDGKDIHVIAGWVADTVQTIEKTYAHLCKRRQASEMDSLDW